MNLKSLFEYIFQLVQYEDNNGDSRVKSKTIDLADLIKVSRTPLENLPKSSDPNAAIQVNTILISLRHSSESNNTRNSFWNA